ncbi:ExbD/TolR family protein [Yoonia sp.]|uniref:ExbD/TolR family protein n=1 Tax=Yoonia sp. TaxID=2212373 RepID=UPI003A4D7338
MRLAPAPRTKPEPTIALINVVFLMLVFFLVAGQVARPADREVTLALADVASARVPDDALVLRADGAILWRGVETSVDNFALAQINETEPLRILPDRNLPARDLIAVAAALRAATGNDVRLVTEKGLAP